MDLCTSVGGSPLVNDFQYGQDATLLLPAGVYAGVFIGAASPDCSAVALPIPTFVVTDGGVGYVYAIGDGTNQPLSVAATPLPGGPAGQPAQPVGGRPSRAKQAVP